MQQCVYCGRTLPEYARFCDQCGRAVSPLPADEIEPMEVQTEEMMPVQEPPEPPEAVWDSAEPPRVRRRRWPWVALGCICAALLAVCLMLYLLPAKQREPDLPAAQIGAATPEEALKRYWMGYETGDAAQEYEALGVDYRAFLTALIQEKYEVPERELVDQIYFDVKRNAFFYDTLGEWMVEEAAEMETLDDVAEFWVAFQGRTVLRRLQMQYGKDYSLRLLSVQTRELSESDKKRQMNVFRNLAEKASEEGGVYCYAPEEIQEVLEISFQIEESGEAHTDQWGPVTWYALRTEQGWFLHTGLGNMDIWQELLRRSYPF